MKPHPRFLLLVVGLSTPMSLSAQTDSLSARAVYTESCARCHDGGADRAPTYEALTELAPGAILSSLERGRMKRYGDELTAHQRRAVAEWLAGRPIVPVTMSANAFCGGLPDVASTSDMLWSGWGGDPAGTGYQPAEAAGLTANDIPHLELVWAFAFPNASEVRSKPAAVGNQLIVASQPGVVYSLDPSIGCVHWSFETEAGIRSSVEVGAGPEGILTAYVVDAATTVYALDVSNGSLLWRTRAGEDPTPMNTGSPVYHDGVVYVPISSTEIVLSANPGFECCASSGGVAAIDARTGERQWYYRVIAEGAREVGRRENGTRILAPSGAPVWSSPTVDVERRLLYVGTGENYTRPASSTSDAVLAINLDDGTLAWSYQATPDDAYNLACTSRSRGENCPDPTGPDLDFGMAPVLTSLPNGRDILVVGQKSGVVFAFDPDHGGEPIWSTRVGHGGMLGGIHWGLATDGRYAYVANADNRFGKSIGDDSDLPWSPGLFALDLSTGDVAWSTPTPRVCRRQRGCIRANSAQPAAIDGIVFAGGLDGHIRAYSTVDGVIVWDYDTARSYLAVNGVEGRGGALDAAGPVIAGGMVFVNSGYAAFSQMSGNVLLAFARR